MNAKAAEKFDTLLINRAYDPHKEPPPDEIVLRIENKNIGSIGNFITLTGMPKNGKGKYMAAIAAGAVSRQEIFGISTRLPEGKNKVAYFDTEQSDYDFYKAMENIKHMAGVSVLPAHFNAFNVREDEPRDILNMIDRYLSLNEDCGLLMLDGLLDLLLSYNDETEAKRLVNALKKWSKIYRLLIPAVLHTGKSNSTTVGHLGAAADRAAQSILVVEKIKERGTFQLRPERLRSAEDFTPIEIFYNTQEHQWQPTMYIPEEPETRRKNTLKPHELDRTTHSTNVMRVFNAEPVQSYDMLVQNIREIYASGREWARTCVPFLMKEQLLFKTPNGYTRDVKAKLFVTS